MTPLCRAAGRYPPISPSEPQMLYEMVVNCAGNTKPSGCWTPTKSPGANFGSIFIPRGSLTRTWTSRPQNSVARKTGFENGSSISSSTYEGRTQRRIQQPRGCIRCKGRSLADDSGIGLSPSCDRLRPGCFSRISSGQLRGLRLESNEGRTSRLAARPANQSPQVNLAAALGRFH